jgi:hypothetical protein
MTRKLLWSLPLAALVASCTHNLKDGVFEKGDIRYSVGALPEGWKQIRLAENDLAFVAEGAPQSIAVNSTCENYDDAPLEVLTQHLLMGFTERTRLEQVAGMMDGRESLRSHYTAKLDGVPMELLLVVLKKDGCVYDFTYLAPPARFEERQGVFDQLLSNFHAERKR